MGSKAPQTEQGKSSKTMAKVSGKKYDLAKVFNPAIDYAAEEATRDNRGILRGRYAGDSAQALAKPTQMGYIPLASGTKGGLKTMSNIIKAGQTAYAGSLAEGSRKGMLSRDANISAVIAQQTGAQGASGQAMGALASQEQKVNTESARIAAQEANNLRGAAWGLASLGVGKAMEGYNDELRDENMKAFKTASAEGGDFHGASYDEWAKATKGTTGGYKADHDSYWKRLGNNFTGLG